MRILHIIDSAGMYGAEVMLLTLAGEQIRQGLRPIICSIGTRAIGEKEIEREARKDNIPVVAFRMLSGPNFIGAWQIVKYAGFTHCDVLHTHGYRGNILFGSLPKKIRLLPLMATLHGWTSSTKPFSRMRLYKWMDAKMLSRMDAVVVVSDGMLGKAGISTNNQVNLHVVHNGIKDEQHDNIVYDNFTNPAPARTKLIAAGRLSPEKGFDILIKAIARVAADGIDVSLVLFGEGKERKKLTQLIELHNLQDRVQMPGFVENVATVFAEFDALILPSFTEGLPITLLEAMRAKLPVIASHVGGIPNALNGGQAGVLVSPGNVEELAEAIAKLSQSKKIRHDLAETANSLFKKHYTAYKMTQSYTRIYADLLGAVM